MPIYVFQCDACGHQFDRLQKLSDPDPTECPECGAGQVRRQLTAPAFRLSGSGWYETDFKKDGDKTRNLTEKGEAAASEGKADNKAETKTKTEPAPAPAKTEASSAPAAAAKSADSKPTS